MAKALAVAAAVFITALILLGLYVAVDPNASWLSLEPSPPNWTTLQGANIELPSLCGCNSASTTTLSASDNLKMMHDLGFNYIRLQINWRLYESNPSGYISNLKQVVSAAQANGIYIMYSAEWQAEHACSDNFWPCNMLTPYGGSPGDSFYSTWWSNSVSHDGTSGWNAMWTNFWQPIISAGDSYTNTLAYEVDNEPHSISSTTNAEVASLQPVHHSKNT